MFKDNVAVSYSQGLRDVPGGCAQHLTATQLPSGVLATGSSRVTACGSVPAGGTALQGGTRQAGYLMGQRLVSQAVKCGPGTASSSHTHSRPGRPHTRSFLLEGKRQQL